MIHKGVHSARRAAHRIVVSLADAEAAKVSKPAVFFLWSGLCLDHLVLPRLPVTNPVAGVNWKPTTAESAQVPS